MIYGLVLARVAPSTPLLPGLSVPKGTSGSPLHTLVQTEEKEEEGKDHKGVNHAVGVT